MTPTPEPMNFTAPDGKRFRLSPLRVADFVDLELFLKGMPLRAARHHIAEMPADQARFLLAYAWNQLESSVHQPMPIAVFQAGLQSAAGQIYALWLSARRNHDELEPDAVAAWATPENSAELTRLVNRACGLADDGTGTLPAPVPVAN